MKIIIINTLYYPERVGGAEISVQLLAEGLVAQGHLVRVLCLSKDKARRESNLNGVSIVYLPLRNIYWPFENSQKSRVKKIFWHLLDQYNFLMKASVGKELDSFGPDLVHTNNLAGFSVAVWDAAKERGLKILHTSRDYYLFHHDCKLFDSKSQTITDPAKLSVVLISWLKRRKSKRVDAYVGISHYIGELHRRFGFFPHSRDSVIYNAIKPPDKSQHSTNSYLEPASKRKLTFGFIGRLTTDKGFDRFCYFAKQVPKASPCSFVAAGSFDGSSSLKDLAIDSDVRYLGYVTLEEFMSQVDVVVLPAQWAEPFGRAVVEAVFHGKIVLTNRVGGIPELARILPNIYFLEDFENFDSFSFKPKSVTQTQISWFESEYVSQQYLSQYAGISAEKLDS